MGGVPIGTEESRPLADSVSSGGAGEEVCASDCSLPIGGLSKEEAGASDSLSSGEGLLSKICSSSRYAISSSSPSS